MYSVDRKHELNDHGDNKLVLTRCPEWNVAGYQVAIWDGQKFVIPELPDDWQFAPYLTAFAPMDESTGETHSL